MNNIVSLFSALFILFASNACIDVAKQQLAPFEEQLVVHSYISPQDTLVQVAVSKNFPVNDRTVAQRQVLGLENLLVTMSEGNNTVVLKYTEPTNLDRANNWRRYTISAKLFPIRAGKTYNLQVQSNDGKNINATCTVPVATLKESDINLSFSSDTFNKEAYKTINITWKDFVNETNYYSFFMQSFVQLADIQANPRNIGQSYNTSLFDDIGKDGALISLPSPIFIIGTNKPFTTASYIDIYLCTTEINYYKYNMSLLQQFTEQRNNQLPEPVSIKENINNGLGVFGAYNLIKIRRTLL